MFRRPQGRAGKALILSFCSWVKLQVGLSIENTTSSEYCEYSQVLGFFIQIDRGCDVWSDFPIWHFDSSRIFAWHLQNFDSSMENLPFFATGGGRWHALEGSTNPSVTRDCDQNSSSTGGCMTHDCWFEWKTPVSLQIVNIYTHKWLWLCYSCECE
jgi:hypothetical protein